MPSKSPAQAKLMRAVAHGWKPDRMKGPSRKVAKEFVAADKKAKGYAFGGAFKKLLAEAADKRTAEERFSDRYGTEPMTLSQARKRAKGGSKLARTVRAARDLKKAGWTPAGKDLDDAVWYPTQETATAPGEGGLAAATQPVRTIQPVAGREFISGAAPPRQVAPAAPARTAAEIAPGFQPGRIPPALVQYLQSLQGAEEPEPVKAQYGGFMNRMRGRGRRGFGGRRGQPQPPGGGMMTSDMGMRAGQARRGQPGQGWSEGPRGGAPGAGVPMRGVGRPPGMGRPGAGSTFGERTRGRGVAGPTRTTQPVGGRQFMPGLGGGADSSPLPPGGGGAPSSLRGLLQQMRQQKQTGGGRPRVGAGDQQGGQARALQVQTGRPPISRRQPFPGRGGPGGGFGRSRGRGRRGRGRFQR